MRRNERITLRVIFLKKNIPRALCKVADISHLLPMKGLVLYPLYKRLWIFPFLKKDFASLFAFSAHEYILLFYFTAHNITQVQLIYLCDVDWEPNFVYFLTYFRNKKTQNLSTFSKRLSHFSLISKVLRLTKDRKISFNEVKTTTRVGKSMSSSCEYLVLLGK